MQIHAGRRRERAQAVDVDLDAALDHAGDEAAGRACRLWRLARPSAWPLLRAAASASARPGRRASRLVDARDEAIADRRHQVVRLHLRAIEDGERLAGQIDHDRGVEHGGDLAEHFFADVKRRAIRRRAVLLRPLLPSLLLRRTAARPRPARRRFGCAPSAAAASLPHLRRFFFRRRLRFLRLVSRPRRCAGCAFGCAVPPRRLRSAASLRRVVSVVAVVLAFSVRLRADRPRRCRLR